MEERNGHYLDKYGCSFGQVNRAQLEDMRMDIEDMKAQAKGINNKLWTLIILLITEMAGAIVYLTTHH